jgi:hypothetical protein
MVDGLHGALPTHGANGQPQNANRRRLVGPDLRELGRTDQIAGVVLETGTTAVRAQYIPNPQAGCTPHKHVVPNLHQVTQGSQDDDVAGAD